MRRTYPAAPVAETIAFTSASIPGVSASTVTGKPTSRIASLVIGPIDANRTEGGSAASAPSSVRKFRAVDALVKVIQSTRFAESASRTAGGSASTGRVS